MCDPSPLDQPSSMPPLEDRFKFMAYCDDVKPCVTSKIEFYIINNGCTLFENSSGCTLHTDPSANKCKFMPLGRWKGTLEQSDFCQSLR